MEFTNTESLEVQINEVRDVEAVAPNVFRCKDHDHQKILIKVHIPEEKSYEEIQQNYDIHLDLLGEDFVEKQIPITIDNPLILDKIKKNILTKHRFYSAKAYSFVVEATKLQGFAQQERDVDSNLWNFIIEKHSSIDDELKSKLITFLERLQDAVKNGYVFDIPPFPAPWEDTAGTKKRNYDNCIVDKKGPTFIDTTHIWKADSPGNMLSLKEQALSIQTALDLLRRKISLQEAFAIMKQEKQKLARGVKLS